MEEIRGITWDFWGVELSHEQTIQRILLGGFPIQGGVALKMFAIVEGESGEYTKAWHANVVRDPDGNITRDENGEMTIKSIDLGFMQFNINVTPNVKMPFDIIMMAEFVEMMYDDHPEYADPWESSRLAYELYKRRGFQPWYAYKPGTEEFKKKMRYGALAFGNWLAHSYVGRKDPFDPKKKLEMIYK